MTAAARAARALARHSPGPRATLRPLGSGLDHDAFLAGDLVVRVGDPDTVRREATLLELLAPRLPLAVPVPRFVDTTDGVLGYRLLTGRSLLGAEPPPGAAVALGAFLRALHDVDPAEVSALVRVEDESPAAWLADLTGPEDLLRVVHATVPEPSGRRVLAHADLGAEHLLADHGRLVAVIDWSDAALADPALDFARLLRDFGPVFLADTLAAYGGLDGAEDRILFHARVAALEDLAYGTAQGPPEYAEAARRSLTWLC